MGFEKEFYPMGICPSLFIFTHRWLLKIKESNFFKYINFEQIKTLRSPLIIRLYEILIKSFQNRDKWEIDAMKLAQKIPMNEKYPADVIPKIKAAVNRINEHTTLRVKLTTLFLTVLTSLLSVQVRRFLSIWCRNPNACQGCKNSILYY